MEGNVGIPHPSLGGVDRGGVTAELTAGVPPHWLGAIVFVLTAYLGYAYWDKYKSIFTGN